MKVDDEFFVALGAESFYRDKSIGISVGCERHKLGAFAGFAGRKFPVFSHGDSWELSVKILG